MISSRTKTKRSGINTTINIKLALSRSFNLIIDRLKYLSIKEIANKIFLYFLVNYSSFQPRKVCIEGHFQLRCYSSLLTIAMNILSNMKHESSDIKRYNSKCFIKKIAAKICILLYSRGNKRFKLLTL